MKFPFSHYSLSLSVCLFAIGFVMQSCQSEEEAGNPNALFKRITSSESGLDFENNLTFDKDFNIYTYRNYYNGGGVAIGDVNGDGLPDIYMTANMTPNKLFLNKSAFRFDDITEKAGVAGTKAWSTGVSMADVNGDGLLDIYVCNSGDIAGDNKQNELFINQGNNAEGVPLFKEMAEAYGIADQGFSTHAAFFDYDRDGDLDLYLLNNSYQAIGSFNLKKNERPKRDPVGGDKLFENQQGRFVDVSVPAGIYGSVIGFGLGVTVGDINKDGWQDIYVSNDFFERDYLYINNQDGTFREVLEDEMRSISAASMGADLADINNDGYSDIFVTDMLPEAEERIKTVTTFDSWDRYQLNLESGYWHQFNRNMLQLNNGDDSFSEIGRLAHVEATDWSWGALIFDFENNGFKDIFIANGIFQDLTNQDFLKFVTEESTVQRIVSNDGVDYKQLIDFIPSHPVPNYAYINNEDLTFTNFSDSLGLGTASFSNGAAYGDLDNDGDLDLVVNNVNMPSFLYMNQSERLVPNNRHLKFELKGQGENTGAFGTKITIYNGEHRYYIEQMPIKGFQSTVDPRPNFGVGSALEVDSVVVNWPNGSTTVLKKVGTNQTLQLSEPDGPVQGLPQPGETHEKMFKNVNDDSFVGFEHKEDKFVDFDRDRLTYHMLSTEGPCLCKGDINGDGRDDFYVGGAKDQPGALFIQTAAGRFIRANEQLLAADKASEDTDCIIFDANNDGKNDLYVASGGSEFSSSSSALADRLYFNDGKGVLRKSNQLLPVNKFENTSTVAAGDFDNDGDLDLFVGMRAVPFYYGLPANGYVLSNDGKGVFTDITASIAPELNELGMITDAAWVDLNQDGNLDLMVAGEWMPLKVFINVNGTLKDDSNKAGLANTEGWWNTLHVTDLNADGLPDIVAGNHGLNSRFRASLSEPITMYIYDFDENGSIEQIITQFNNGASYPMVLKHDLVMQLPGLKKKYLKHENFKGEKMENIFSKEALDKARKLKTVMLESVVLVNDGKGGFDISPLPTVAQFAPIYAIASGDYNKDGSADILTAGNFFSAKPEVGRYDASYGTFLIGNGAGEFKSVPSKESGLVIKGQARDMAFLQVGKNQLLFIANNNQPVQVVAYNPESVIIPQKTIEMNK